MLPRVDSVSSGIIGFVGNVSDIERWDIHSNSALVLITSLVFLIPAFSAWRIKKIWHSCTFVLMTVVCLSYHYCTAETPKELRVHGHPQCSPTALYMSTRMFYFTIHFCFLQLAFMVMGPEDPHLQWLGNKGVHADFSGALPTKAPFDVIVTSRILPTVALCGFHFGYAAWGAADVHWQGLLLNEMILLVCGMAFWLHRSRRSKAADVLMRFKYWHRLLHQGFVPAMMLFWIFCIMGFGDFRALHSMWHVLVAFFAQNLLKTVLVGESTSLSAKVLDVSPNNPYVAHVLLGSVALVVVPSAVIGASFDWCNNGSNNWAMISSTSQCQPGGYFVAIVAVPTFAAMATVFWLIASTSSGRSVWTYFHQSRPREVLAAKTRDIASYDHGHLSMGKTLGCFLGHGGCFFGLASTLVMKGLPMQGVFNLFAGIMALGLMMIAMSLTVLSSDSSSQTYQLRHRLTFWLCLPIMVLHAALTLSEQFSLLSFKVPQMAAALTEYAVVLLLAMWPLTWAPEVQDVWRRNAISSFNWPTTDFRFV